MPAVNTPVLVIVPPPATTDQVGVIATLPPALSLASAVKVIVPPTGTGLTAGLTVMDASSGASTPVDQSRPQERARSAARRLAAPRAAMEREQVVGFMSVSLLVRG